MSDKASNQRSARALIEELHGYVTAVSDPLGYNNALQAVEAALDRDAVETSATPDALRVLAEVRRRVHEMKERHLPGLFTDEMGRLGELMATVLGPETPVKAPATRAQSASERLHNICDALSEQAEESPFTREEWDRIDAQTVQMQEQIRVASHALGAIAGGDIYPQKLAREALNLMRGAVKTPAPRVDCPHNECTRSPACGEHCQEPL